MNEMLKRSLSGAVYVILVLACLHAGVLPFALLMGLFLLAGISEMMRLVLATPRRRIFGVLWMVSLLLLFSGLTVGWFRNAAPAAAPALLLASAVMTVSLFLFTPSSLRRNTLVFIHHTLLLLDLPLFLTVALTDPLREGTHHTPYVLSMLLIIWAYDTFAYLSGKAIGRTPLAPAISPKKTREGAAGGLAGVIVVALLLGHFGDIFQTWQWITFGLAVAITATIGDLYESQLKRKAGVKDSSHLIPGHGGILDRIDSLFFGAPTGFLIILLFLYSKR